MDKVFSSEPELVVEQPKFDRIIDRLYAEITRYENLEAEVNSRVLRLGSSNADANSTGKDIPQPDTVIERLNDVLESLININTRFSSTAERLRELV